MKDMERWAKIQNSKKESVRAPSPVLKSGDDHRPSKAADAAFAIFERKVRSPFSLFFFNPLLSIKVVVGLFLFLDKVLILHLSKEFRP